MGFDHEGVIAGGAKGRRQPIEDAAAVMNDPGGFAVQGLGGSYGPAPENFIDALHPQAYPQNGHPDRG